MTEKELRQKAMALPLQPGVYIMKNKDKKIIYVGKAKKLKNRVSSYFGAHTNHSLKVIRMVENVDDFEKAFIKCGAIEAAKPVKIENAVDDDDIALIDQATEEIVEAFNG